MTLYFVYGNQQKKKIICSDYAEDIYDMIIDFFEVHKSFPHFLNISLVDNIVIINMEKTTEHFCITDIDSDSYEKLKNLVNKYTR